MTYRKFRIFLAKGWTLIVCSVSLAVMALAVSCRSKKATKAQETIVEEEKAPEEVVDEKATTRASRDLSPMVELPGDSKAVKEMIQESNALKQTLSRRMNSVIYGTPEIMEQRAAENEQMKHKIDSLDTEIKKARQQ